MRGYAPALIALSGAVYSFCMFLLSRLQYLQNRLMCS